MAETAAVVAEEAGPLLVATCAKAGDTSCMGESGAVRCSNCHSMLPVGFDLDFPRAPCPDCGSIARTVLQELNAQVSASGTLIAHGQPAGGGHSGEAVRVGRSDGRIAVADAVGATEAEHVEGRAPRGEEGRGEVAAILIGKLRGTGEEWGEPVEIDEQDVDVRATRGHETLNIQVTRIADTSGWQALHHTGHVDRAASADQLADEIAATVAKKARLPAAQMTTLTLAIDARDTPAFALRAVVKSFHSRRAIEIARLGFQAVWIVGPTVALTHRLDR